MLKLTAFVLAVIALAGSANAGAQERSPVVPASAQKRLCTRLVGAGPHRATVVTPCAVGQHVGHGYVFSTTRG